MALGNRLRRGFVTGLFVIAPLAVTVIILRFLYLWIVGLLTPFLRVVTANVTPVVEFAATLVLVAAVTALGVVVRRGVGQYLVAEFDQVMETIPVVRSIYSSARQASNAMLGDDHGVERVALVEWPDAGLHTVGFVTDETQDRLTTSLDGECHYNVFVPMAPNPMGGFLAVVPASRTTMTDLSVSEGIQLVMTSGMSGDAEGSETLVGV